MTINAHLDDFAGRRVIQWAPGDALPNPQEAICRITIDYEESEDGTKWVDRLGEFLALPGSDELRGLVVGAWESVSYNEENTVGAIVAALAAARDRLPHLDTIFFGDIIMEEAEISWITQGDMGPLLAAYPNLRHFGVRGGNDLTFGELRHEQLQTLVVQAGGLPASVVREVAAADLPALRHLELWLGTPNYGGDATVEDFAPILAGQRFPVLSRLGLCNSEIADEVAAAVANAPILGRIATLDLSLGTLTDTGAAALLASPAVARLQKLDLHHHFLSDEMMERLRALPPEVDLEEQEEPDEYKGEIYRYVAVGE